MKNPNILVIMSDDHGHWALRCSGNDEVHTPNIDRIAKEGVLFENFFCASPVCSPARASFMTGKIPSQHGVHDWIHKGHANESDVDDEIMNHFKNDNNPSLAWITQSLKNDKAISYLKNEVCFTDILSENGYVCGISGKWHLGDSANAQHGFTYWQTIALGGDHYYNSAVLKDNKFSLLEKGVYLTDYITENGLDFLKMQKDKKEPFFLAVNYTAPHTPWEKHEHPKQFYNMYENCLCKSVGDEMPHRHSPHKDLSFEEMKEVKDKSLKGYYSAITAMDKGIGDILDFLDENNLSDDTLIFFTGDNGMSIGQHGIIGKGNGTFPVNMYDTAIKVPAIIKYPKKISANVVKKELVSHYDFFPTLLDMLNLKHNINIENLVGKSFLPLLENKNIESKNIFIMDEYGPTRMIRTDSFKYIHRYPYGEHELYDLTKDPDEKENLVNDKSYKDKKEELFDMLEKWYYANANPEVDGKCEPVKGYGQTGLCGIYKKGKDAFVQ